MSVSANSGERNGALVFISYSSDPDQSAAEEFTATLERAGIPCWIASRDIGPGENYAASIINAIENCKVMILLLSAAANRSPHVANEIERAVNYRKDIVPIRIEEVPPARSIELHLSSRQWIDLFDARRREKNMARLTDALRNRLREWLVPDLPPLPIGGGHAAETAAIASLDQPDSVGTPPADHKPTSEAIPATRSSLTLSPTPLPQSVPEVLQAVYLRLKNPSSDPGIDAAELFKQFDVQVLSELCSIVSKSQDYFGAGPINVLRFCCAQPRARQFAQGILSVLCECLKK